MIGANLNALALVLLMAVTTPSGQPAPKQSSDYTPAGPAHLVTWQVKRVVPPSPLYVDVDDKLNVGVASFWTNEVVTVNYRLLRAADGVIVRGQFTVTAPTPYTLSTKQQQLAEGYLLSVSCKAALGATRGQTFVRLFIGAGSYGAGQPAYMLMSDYVTTAMAPAFPNGRQVSPIEGPGWVHTYSAAPAAGADFVMTAPSNSRLRVINVNGVLATSAAVATRAPHLQLFPTTDNNSITATPATLAASLTVGYVWGPGLSKYNDGVTRISDGLPDGWIIMGGQAGFNSVGSVTGNLQVGDQWSHVYMTVEEWLDNV